QNEGWRTGAPAGPREGLSPRHSISDCTAVSVLASLRTAGVQHGGHMTARQLPERPNLEQLKRQAKDLLHSARARDQAALARFRILPSFAHRSNDDLGRGPLALLDAQSVVAREYGFDSWHALRERVEELGFEFGAAVE